LVIVSCSGDCRLPVFLEMKGLICCMASGTFITTRRASQVAAWTAGRLGVLQGKAAKALKKVV
jgi:hypothetical protein